MLYTSRDFNTKNVARVTSVQWTDHRKWETYSYRPTLLLSMPKWRTDKKLAIRLAYYKPTASSPNGLQIPGKQNPITIGLS